jgi:hypothetical protein
MTLRPPARRLRRHKLLTLDGALLAVVAALLATFEPHGLRLVSRASPTYESEVVVAVVPGTPTAALPTAAAPPPERPLATTIDARALHDATRSLQVIVTSPGFAESVASRLDGSVAAISGAVVDDTNSMVLVFSAPTRQDVEATGTAAIAELRTVARFYGESPASTYPLDVTAAPSSAAVAVGSSRSVLTFLGVGTLVFSLWCCVIGWIDRRRGDGQPSPSSPLPLPLPLPPSPSAPVPTPAPPPG